MKLSEFAAELKSIKETIASFISDKTKAASDALSALSAKLTKLETESALEISTKTTELATAQTANTELTGKLSASNTELSTVNTALKNACSSLKLEVKENATNVEMVSLLQTAVTSTLARLQVDVAKVPAGVPTTAAGQAAKKKSLDEEIRDRKAATATK